MLNSNKQEVVKKDNKLSAPKKEPTKNIRFKQLLKMHYRIGRFFCYHLWLLLSWNLDVDRETATIANATANTAAIAYANANASVAASANATTTATNKRKLPRTVTNLKNKT